MEIHGESGELYIKNLFSGYLFENVEVDTHDQKIRRGLIMAPSSKNSRTPHVHRVMCPIHLRSQHGWVAWRGNGRSWVEGCQSCGTQEHIRDIRLGTYLIGQDPVVGREKIDAVIAIARAERELYNITWRAQTTAQGNILTRYKVELEEETALQTKKAKEDLFAQLERMGRGWIIQHL